MNKILLIFLFVLSSCGSQELFQFKYLKRTPISNTHTIAEVEKGKEDTFNINKWSILLFISNNYESNDPFKIPYDLCKGKDVITNLSGTYRYAMLPPLWLNLNYDYTGTCHE